MIVIYFFNTSVSIRLWQFKAAAFLHRSLLHSVIYHLRVDWHEFLSIPSRFFSNYNPMGASLDAWFKGIYPNGISCHYMCPNAIRSDGNCPIDICSNNVIFVLSWLFKIKRVFSRHLLCFFLSSRHLFVPTILILEDFVIKSLLWRHSF